MSRKVHPSLETFRGPHEGAMGWAHFRDPTPTAQQLGLWVSSVGHVRNRNPGAVIESRLLGCYGAWIVARGSAWFSSPTTGRCDVNEGTLVWMFPEVAHSHAPTSSEWLEYWVLFDGPIAEHLEQGGHLRPEAPFARTGDDEAIPTLLERLRLGFIDASPSSEIGTAALVLELVARTGATSPLSALRETVDPLVRRAHSWVDQRALQHDFGPELVAKHLRVSYSTLRRRLQQANAESVKARITRVRLDKAKELLAVSTLSVDHIAHAVGFQSASYFVRFFRAHEGVTPGDFRRRHAGSI